MEEIFQELLLSVGISVALCCMIMKLKPCGNEEGGEAFKKNEEQKLSFGSGKNLGAWPITKFVEQFSGEKFYDTNVTRNVEVASELVEDEEVMLHGLSVEKEVGGDESKCLSEEICNVINDRHVVSEIIEDGGVLEILRRGEDYVDGYIERLSNHEIEECFENPVEEDKLRLNNLEIEDDYKRLGDGKTENENFDGVEQGLYEDDELSQAEIEENSQFLGIEDGEQSGYRGEKEEEGVFDDWEGVERTELEKLFGAAVVFVGSQSNAGLIDRDMKIELYGRHKIALEGPCRGTQPMALKISARAKWDCWKRLGNMSRELAMEQYLFILSERVPGWRKSNIPVKQSHY